MKNEVIQRLGYVAGEIVKGYAGKSTQQGPATGGMSENVTFGSARSDLCFMYRYTQNPKLQG